MLHTKFRDNWSGEEDFQRVFTIYGWGPTIGWFASNKLSCLFPKEAPHEIWL